MVSENGPSFRLVLPSRTVRQVAVAVGCRASPALEMSLGDHVLGELAVGLEGLRVVVAGFLVVDQCH